jgi:hypothetical protein
VTESERAVVMEIRTIRGARPRHRHPGGRRPVAATPVVAAEETEIAKEIRKALARERERRTWLMS